jgi:hypothetical protein
LCEVREANPATSGEQTSLPLREDEGGSASFYPDGRMAVFHGQRKLPSWKTASIWGAVSSTSAPTRPSTTASTAWCSWIGKTETFPLPTLHRTVSGTRLSQVRRLATVFVRFAAGFFPAPFEGVPELVEKIFPCGEDRQTGRCDYTQKRQPHFNPLRLSE